MKVGRQKNIYIPWWRAWWMWLTGEWEPFLAHVERQDAIAEHCPICGATEGRKCDAGLHG